MCLIIDSEKFKVPCVALEDIECYKVVAETIYGDFISPFVGYCYEIGKEECGVICVEDDKVLTGFHSYVQVEDAFKMKGKMLDIFNCEFKVVRCIIPKGSSYYVGEVDTGYEDEIYGDGVFPDGYVSDSIRIVDIISEEN